MEHLGECPDIDVVTRWFDPRGSRVIDVGYGQGELARQLAARGALVLGVEPHPDQLAAAEAAAGVRFVQGEAQGLPAPDASATVVVFNRSLHHVPEAAMDEALQEAVRVLDVGGLLIVGEPEAAVSGSQALAPLHDQQHLRTCAQRALDRLGPPLEAVDTVRYDRVTTSPDPPTRCAAMHEATPRGVDEAALEGPDVAARFSAGHTPQGHLGFPNAILVRVFRR